MLKIKKTKVLITPKDFKPSTKGYEVIGVFNPGALRLKNGDILLYVRVAERPIKWEEKDYCYSPRFISDKDFKLGLDKFERNKIGIIHEPHSFVLKNGITRLGDISHFRRVFLDKEGLHVKKIEQKPAFYGTINDGELGIEDPRITKIKNKYIMTYVSLSRLNGISTNYAISNDGIKWHKEGIMFRHQNKDVVLFPEKIKNRYVAFHRPDGNFNFSLAHMWISYSKDLKYWGDDESVLMAEKAWESKKIGASTVPIKTKQGWLEFYHGAKIEDSKRHYCVGAALFDLKNPGKLICKSHEPLIIPILKEEKGSFGYNVVFPTGAILSEDKKNILLYSGGADEVTTVKEIGLKEVLKYLKKGQSKK